MQHFNDAGLPLLLTQALERMGFSTPTPIQSQAIPLALEGKDILGSAQTGTGKTGAFGIPLVAKLLNEPHSEALVLTPTRELATQVLEAIKKMLATSSIKTALLIGGDPMFKQLQQLKAKPRVIVGTPGRINDHLSRGSLKLRNTNFLVLDETDRMLDMGFGIQLEQIAKHLGETRQTLMFSATMPHNIMQLANKYLVEPVRIEVGENSAPAAQIKQEQVHLRESEKYPHLLTELETREGSVIVFVKTKWAADQLAQKLTNDNHEADALHGDLRQKQRDRVVSSFRREHYRVLVATDIAARGLDIPHIAHVINYDMPQNPEDYIHRIGRTARAGAEGSALNMLSPQDGGKWRAIQRLINPHEKPERSARTEGGNKRPQRDGVRKPQGEYRERSERSFGGERVFDRKPHNDRNKPYGERSERSESNRHPDSGERSFNRDRNDRSFGDRRPYGDRNERPFNSTRSEGNRHADSGERSFSDRKPYGGQSGERAFNSERNERKPYGDRKPYGERNERPFNSSRSEGNRHADSGERSFGDRKPYAGQSGERSFNGERNERKPYGERTNGNARNDRPFGDRKPFGDKKPFGEKKTFGDKKTFGEKKAFGERKTSSESFFNDRSSSKPAGKRAFSGKREDSKSYDGDKPFSRKKRFA